MRASMYCLICAWLHDADMVAIAHIIAMLLPSDMNCRCCSCEWYQQAGGVTLLDQHYRVVETVKEQHQSQCTLAAKMQPHMQLQRTTPMLQIRLEAHCDATHRLSLDIRVLLCQGELNVARA